MGVQQMDNVLDVEIKYCRMDREIGSKKGPK
jgi:hypothetical protein